MPIYQYLCPQCDESFEALRHVALRYVATCPTCSETGRLLISLPARLADIDYYDDGLGMHVTSREQRRKEMKSRGLDEVGTTHKHGATGALYSMPGKVATAAKPSGAYAKKVF